ncbi:protein disulfide-isomerase A3 [Palaemon carinicauda]|uniref:protein disulfide-isomerase A3 n=1 Tax=Palaemon carinicauda TaxID=392227 RepID=UPI0035B6319E
MLTKIVVLFAILAVSLGDEVLQFNDADFDGKVASYDTILVMFYAPWCGHCKRLKPEFEKAAPILKANDPPVMLAKVDCTDDGKESCGRFGVSGYPTLKIFKGGDLSSDYNGPRDASGIVKFMRSQVGPASKELTSVETAEAFLSSPEVGVVYFGGESKLKDAFMKTADKLRESVRFAHSLTAAVNEHYGKQDVVVLFRPKHLGNKFEPDSVTYEGSEDKVEIESFIKKNFHGLAGHRTPDTAQDFRQPLVVAYYNVDYVKNIKGTNYWRNRVLKVALKFADDFTFAVANKDDFQHELNEYGLDFVAGDKPVICARNAKSQKFVMAEEFSMETFEAFLGKLKAGELEPYLKSEEIPDQTGPVKIAVGKNFDELVTNSDKDVLIEFYAPWCGHCKKLAPTYDELGEKMAGESVDIVKMDATANDVPSSFNVQGFPTIFWKPKGGSPVNYNGGRELDDFIKYIAKEATEELKGFDRKGKAKKSEL